jgi:hypothetical protein
MALSSTTAAGFCIMTETMVRISMLESGYLGVEEPMLGLEGVGDGFVDAPG